MIYFDNASTEFSSKDTKNIVTATTVIAIKEISILFLFSNIIKPPINKITSY